MSLRLFYPSFGILWVDCLWVSGGVILSVTANYGVGSQACGVDGADKVGITGIEQAAIAFMDFQHGDSRVWF